MKNKASTAHCLFFCSLSFLLLLGAASDLLAQSILRVGIIGDQTYSTDIQKSYQILERAVESLSRENVACALHTGDLLESSVSPEEYRAQFAQATKILDKLGKPWHLAAGDHDVNPPEFKPDSPDRSREDLYRELYRRREPRLTKTLNHSFDLAGYHFIALNSQEHLHVDPRWGDVFLDRLTPEQYAWLELDLAEHRNAKGIVVFIHQPMWYHWSGWMPIHQLLRRYPVLAVVAGHFHYSQDEGELDHIRYFVVGAAGGVIKQASAEAGHVHHVTVMAIQGHKIEFRLIPIDGSGPLRTTPRTDMDRVQAIDTSLYDLLGFDDQNSLCLRSNQLYRNGSEPAKISLVPVGNPIDLPVRVSIRLLGEKLILVNPHFMAGVCQVVSSDDECVLSPGARVEFSNTSSVVLSQRLTPMWESGLGISKGKTLKVGDAIEVEVHLSLRGSNGDLFVEGLAKTNIKACPPSSAVLDEKGLVVPQPKKGRPIWVHAGEPRKRLLQSVPTKRFRDDKYAKLWGKI